MTEPAPGGAAGQLEAASPRAEHAWFAWSALPDRPPVTLPHGATVAVSIVLDLGAVEWEAADHAPTVPPIGGRGIAPYPDLPRMSHREFGHRVGVFRLLDILRGLAITPAAVIDVLTVEQYLPLLEHLRPAVGEFVAGGLSASRPITSAMTEAEEQHYIASTMDRLEAALGVRPAGWLGPEHSESTRTPGLLADAALQYVADWGNDDQPYPMGGTGDRLWTFPLSWELSDAAAVHHREVGPDSYGQSLIEAFDVLSDEGVASGRVLGLHLRPWLSGQAFRAGAVEHALTHIRNHPRVWLATPLETVDWYRRTRTAR